MKTNCPECELQKKNICNPEIVDSRCIKYNPDDISYSQHRLYRGLLLTALTEALGESNTQYCHEFILKPEWIYRATGKYCYYINSFSEIPLKHQNSGRVIIEYSEGYEGVPQNSIVVGYIPSMSKFTKAETKDYFLFCDTMLGEIGGSIPTEHNQEYKQLKERVFK